MNGEYNEADRARRQAADDLSDIHTLKSTEAFARYYLRRIAQKRDAVKTRFITAPPKDVDAAEREILRRLLESYEELLALPDRDAAIAAAFLDRNT